MPKGWDQAREQELLLAIHAVHSPFDWNAIADKIGDATPNALKKHFGVIKKLQDSGGLKAASEKKRATPSKTSGKAAKPSTKKAMKVEETDEDSDTAKDLVDSED